MTRRSDLSVSSILRPALVGALPALAMLAVIAVADLALDGWVVVAVIAFALAGLFAGDALLARTASGAAQLGAYARRVDTLDAGERKMNTAARYLPVGLAVVVLVASGASAAAVAIVLLAGYVLAQLAFAVWLRGRRDRVTYATRA